MYNNYFDIYNRSRLDEKAIRKFAQKVAGEIAGKREVDFFAETEKENFKGWYLTERRCHSWMGDIDNYFKGNSKYRQERGIFFLSDDGSLRCCRKIRKIYKDFDIKSGRCEESMTTKVFEMNTMDILRFDAPPLEKGVLDEKTDYDNFDIDFSKVYYEQKGIGLSIELQKLREVDGFDPERANPMDYVNRQGNQIIVFGDVIGSQIQQGTFGSSQTISSKCVGMLNTKQHD